MPFIFERSLFNHELKEVDSAIGNPFKFSLQAVVAEEEFSPLVFGFSGASSSMGKNVEEARQLSAALALRALNPDNQHKVYAYTGENSFQLNRAVIHGLQPIAVTPQALALQLDLAPKVVEAIEKSPADYWLAYAVKIPERLDEPYVTARPVKVGTGRVSSAVDIVIDEDFHYPKATPLTVQQEDMLAGQSISARENRDNSIHLIACLVRAEPVIANEDFREGGNRFITAYSSIDQADSSGNQSEKVWESPSISPKDFRKKVTLGANLIFASEWQGQKFTQEQITLQNHAQLSMAGMTELTVMMLGYPEEEIAPEAIVNTMALQVKGLEVQTKPECSDWHFAVPDSERLTHNTRYTQLVESMQPQFWRFSINKIALEELADAGLGRQPQPDVGTDRVVCCAKECGVALYNWDLDDIPRKEHSDHSKKKNGQCPVVNSSFQNQLPPNTLQYGVVKGSVGKLEWHISGYKMLLATSKQLHNSLHPNHQTPFTIESETFEDHLGNRLKLVLVPVTGNHTQLHVVSVYIEPVSAAKNQQLDADKNAMLTLHKINGEGEVKALGSQLVSFTLRPGVRHGFEAELSPEEDKLIITFIMGYTN